MAVVLKHEQMQRLGNLIRRTRDDKVAFGKTFFGKDLSDSQWQVDAVRMGGQTSTKVAGRRSGKTLTTTIDMMHACATQQNQAWYVTGPSLDQAQLYFNEIEEAANHPNGLMEALITGEIRRSPFPGIKLVTGSEINARSTARDGVYLRGKGANGVAVTEAAFIKDVVYQEVIRAMVLDRRGVLRLESTPNGDNYFRMLHALAADPERREQVPGTERAWMDPSGRYRTLHATVHDNKRLAPDEIEAIRLELPEWVWRVEYLAEFLSDQENIFAWSLLTDLFAEDYAPQLQALYTHRYVIGADLAQINDYTAIVVLDVTFWPVTVARWLYYRGKPYTGAGDSVVSDINGLRREFNNARVIIDATNERAVAEQVVGAEAFVFSQNTRNLLLSNMQVLAQNRKYKLPASFTRLRDEMRHLKRIQIGHSGHTRVDHPKGGFDDTVIALALASWPLRSMPSPGDHAALEAFRGSTFYGDDQ